MTTTPEISTIHIQCPRCKEKEGVETALPADNSAYCKFCSWKGSVFQFDPLLEKAEKASEAMPEDSVCLYHPNKRAETVCAGSGDYICSLCAIELDGEIYSAEFLNKGGKQKFSENFERYIDRPDRKVSAALAISILILPLCIFAVPFGIYYFFKTLTQRKDDKLYKALITRFQIWLSGISLTLFSVGIIVVIAMIVFDL